MFFFHLGLLHEQSRPDRDGHVEIMWNNIASNMGYNFNKQGDYNINSLGTPFFYTFQPLQSYAFIDYARSWKALIANPKKGSSLAHGLRRSNEA